MSLLPLIVAAFFLLQRQKNNNISRLLSNLSVEDVLPVLTYFGVDKNTVEAISGIIAQVMSDDADLLSIIKTAIPLITAFMQKNSNFWTKPDEGIATPSADEGTSPISGFAPADITDGINSYFS